MVQDGPAYNQPVHYYYGVSFNGSILLRVKFVCWYLRVQESQKHRAGGTVCSRLSTVADVFHSDVVTTDPCPRRMIQPVAGKMPQNL